MACFTWCHFLHTSVESQKGKCSSEIKVMKVLVVTVYTQYVTPYEKGIAVKNQTFLFICRSMRNILKNLVGSGLGHNVVLCVFVYVHFWHSFFCIIHYLFPPPIVFPSWENLWKCCKVSHLLLLANRKT